MAAETEVARLVARLVGDGKQFRAMLVQAEAQARTASARISQSFAAIGGAIKAAFGFAFVAAIGGAAKAFAQFDRAMVESTSIMHVTTEQMERMRDTALRLSADAPQSATELARSYFFLASAGKNAEQSMALLPRVMAFATAGAFDLATATDLLTDAQSALKLSSKDVAKDTKNLVRVSDVLVKANTLANASVSQFSVSLTSGAGAALAAFNKDVEEGVAVLAAMADQGIKAEKAGMALDRIMRLLSASTIDNAKAHERFGFRVFDAGGKMRNFADIIANLEDILGDMSDQMKVNTLDALGFQARVQQVILPLLGTSDAIRKYEKELRTAGGTTKDVADKQMKSLSNEFKVLLNNLSNFAKDIVRDVLPAINKLTEGLTKLFGVMQGFTSLGEDIGRLTTVDLDLQTQRIKEQTRQMKARNDEMEEAIKLQDVWGEVSKKREVERAAIRLSTLQEAVKTAESRLAGVLSTRSHERPEGFRPRTREERLGITATRDTAQKAAEQHLRNARNALAAFQDEQANASQVAAQNETRNRLAAFKDRLLKQRELSKQFTKEQQAQMEKQVAMTARFMARRMPQNLASVGRNIGGNMAGAFDAMFFTGDARRRQQQGGMLAPRAAVGVGSLEAGERQAQMEQQLTEARKSLRLEQQQLKEQQKQNTNLRNLIDAVKSNVFMVDEANLNPL